MLVERLRVAAFENGMITLVCRVVKRVSLTFALLCSIQGSISGQQPPVYYLYISGTPALNDVVTCYEPVATTSSVIRIRAGCDGAIANSFYGSQNVIYSSDDKNISIEGEFSRNLKCLDDKFFSTSGSMTVKVLFNNLIYGQYYSYSRYGPYMPPKLNEMCTDIINYGAFSFGISPPRPSGVNTYEANIEGVKVTAGMSLDNSTIYLRPVLHPDIRSFPSDYQYEVEYRYADSDGWNRIGTVYECSSDYAPIYLPNCSSWPNSTPDGGKYIYFHTRVIRKAGNANFKYSPWSSTFPYSVYHQPTITISETALSCHDTPIPLTFTATDICQYVNSINIIKLNPDNSQAGIVLTLTKGSPSGRTAESFPADCKFDYLFVKDASVYYTKPQNAVSLTNPLQVTPGAVGSNQAICYNNTPSALLETAAPANGSSYTYQWESSPDGSAWSPVTGATSPAYAPGPLTSTTYFRRNVSSGGCGPFNSTPVKITVYNDITAGEVALTSAICYGDTPDAFTSNSLPAGGDGNFTYQWQSSTSGSIYSDIGNAKSATYQPGALNTTTYFRRTEKAYCKTVYSNVLTVNVYESISGGTLNAPPSICYSTIPNTFMGTAPAGGGGNGTYTYQWKINTNSGADWLNIPNSNEASYTELATLFSSTQYKRVAIASNGCSAESNPITVTVYPQLIGGSIDPAPAICHSTSPSIFTVTSPAGGMGTYTYQWKRSIDGGAIWAEVATTENYTETENLTALTQYKRVTTSGGCGSAETNVVEVNVYGLVDGGNIGMVDPVCYNGDPSEIGNSTSPQGGNGPWAYLWESKSEGGAWSTIPDTYGLTYNPPGGAQRTTIYRRKATNDCGSGYSNEIASIVYTPLYGGEFGKDTTICYNIIPETLTQRVAPDGGTGSYTYQWEISSNSTDWSDISNATYSFFSPQRLTSTTYYRVRVVDISCGSSRSSAVTITVNGSLNGGAIGDNQTICSIDDPAAFRSITLPSGGRGPWIYRWEYRVGTGSWNAIPGSNAQVYDVPSGLAQTTTYRRISANTCGSRESNSASITVNLVPVANAGVDLVICSGATTQIGAAAVTGSTYSWTSNPAGFTSTLPRPTVSPTATTTYTLVETITATGCNRSNSITVTVNPKPVLGVPELIPNDCFDGKSGKISISASGGTPSYTYTLACGGNTPITTADGVFKNLPAASDYSITVEDVNGCRDTTGGITITQPSEQFTLTVTRLQSITSPGGGDGWAELQVSGGTPNFEFSKDGSLWISSLSTYRFNNLMYSDKPFSVKDSKGCIVTAVNPVTQPNPILPVADITQVICKGESNGKISLTVTGGTGQYTLTLTDTKSATQVKSNVINAAEFDGLKADTYTLDIKDANNCSISKEFKVLEPTSPISLTFTPILPSCNGLFDGEIAVVPAGGWGKQNYSFANLSNGSIYSNGKFSGVSAGTYPVSVTDSLGCALESSYTLNQPQLLELAVKRTTNLSCHGDKTGIIELTTKGGTKGYTFSLSEGANPLVTSSPDSTFRNLSASSSYTLTVTDDKGCIASVRDTITQPDSLTINISNRIGNGLSINCPGKKDTVWVKPSGGTIHYRIEPRSGIAPSYYSKGFALYDKPNGKYHFKIVDGNGCEKIDSALISNLPGPKFEAISITDAKCANTADGIITIKPWSATGSETISWYYISAADTTLVASSADTVFSIARSGRYITTITDTLTCAHDTTITVGSPPAIIISQAKKREPKCFGSTDGNLSITASGRTPSDFKYVWYNHAQAKVSEVDSTGAIPSGTYSVIVSDSKGCSNTSTYTVIDPPTLQPNLPSSVTICSNQTYMVDAGVSGTSFFWSSAGGYSASGRTATLTDAGIYTLLVTDAKGCSGRDTLTLVKLADIIDANFIMANRACVGDTLVLIEMSWPIPEVIEWNYPASFTQIFGNEYSVHLIPRQVGNFSLGLTSHVGQCWSDVYKTIIIEPAKGKGNRSESQSIIRAVSAYPNPNNGNFSVEVELNRLSDVLIEVYSLYGSRLFFKHDNGLERYKVDVNQFRTPGIYLVRVTAGNESRSLRVVVE